MCKGGKKEESTGEETKKREVLFKDTGKAKMV